MKVKDLVKLEEQDSPRCKVRFTKLDGGFDHDGEIARTEYLTKDNGEDFENKGEALQWAARLYKQRDRLRVRNIEVLNAVGRPVYTERDMHAHLDAKWDEQNARGH